MSKNRDSCGWNRGVINDQLGYDELTVRSKTFYSMPVRFVEYFLTLGFEQTISYFVVMSIDVHIVGLLLY